MSANYSTMSSTLQYLRAQHIPLIQAEERANTLFKTLQERTGALYKAVVQYFLDNPKKDINEAKIKVNRDSIQPMVFVTITEFLDTRCWSSKRMSELMNWRNPDEQAKPTALRSILNITKRVITEVALPFLTVTAAVEAIATKALVVIGQKQYSGINSSACFTTLWTATSSWHNVMTKSLSVDEHVARQELFKGYFKL